MMVVELFILRKFEFFILQFFIRIFLSICSYLALVLLILVFLLIELLFLVLLLLLIFFGVEFEIDRLLSAVEAVTIVLFGGGIFGKKSIEGIFRRTNDWMKKVYFEERFPPRCSIFQTLKAQDPPLDKPPPLLRHCL